MTVFVPDPPTDPGIIPINAGTVGPIALRSTGSGTLHTDRHGLVACKQLIDMDADGDPALSATDFGSIRGAFFQGKTTDDKSWHFAMNCAVVARSSSAGFLDVREIDRNGSWVSGSVAFNVPDMTAFNFDGTTGTAQASGVGLLVGDTTGNPVFIANTRADMIFDISDNSSGATNLSTRFYGASAFGAFIFSDAHVNRPINDVLGINLNSLTRSGDLAEGFLIHLIADEDDGSTRLQRYSDGSGNAAGSLFGANGGVIRYRHKDKTIASGLAVRTDAEYWTGTQTDPVTADTKGGPLNFHPSTLSITTQYLSGFSTGGIAPPYVESQPVFNESFNYWNSLHPAVTIISSGSDGHVVSKSLSDDNNRWSDIFTFAPDGKLAVDETKAQITDNSTAETAIIKTIIRAGNDSAGAINVSDGHAWDERLSAGSQTAPLKNTLKLINHEDALGSGHFGLGVQASGLWWASGSHQGIMATQHEMGGSAFASRSIGGGHTALGFMTFASGNEQVFYFRPATVLPHLDPTLMNISTGTGTAFTDADGWPGGTHYGYDFTLIFNASSFDAGNYTGQVHNLGTSVDMLVAGSRVKAWWNNTVGGWWCSVPALGAS